MSKRQKQIVLIAVGLIIFSVIFPPFDLRMPGGGTINQGYGFLFSPPRNGVATVNAGLLLIELVVVAILAAAFWFLNAHAVDPMRVQLSEVAKRRWNKAIRIVAYLGGLLIAVSITIAITGRTPFTSRVVFPSNNQIQPSYSSPPTNTGLNSEIPTWNNVVKNSAPPSNVGLNPALAQFDAEHPSGAAQTWDQFVAEQAAKAEVECVHPGWQSLVRTADFTNWMKRQSAPVQALANSPMPADAIKMLNLYKHDHASVARVSTNSQAQSVDNTLREMAAQVSRNLPMKVNAEVQATAVSVSGNRIMYKYNVIVPVKTLDISHLSDEHYKNAVNGMCSNSGMLNLLKQGAILMYQFYDSHNSFLFEFSITQQDCNG
jgi:hypothetical protein